MVRDPWRSSSASPVAPISPTASAASRPSSSPPSALSRSRSSTCSPRSATTGSCLVGFLLGYVSLIMFSPMGTFMTELYPDRGPRRGPGLLLQCRPRHRRIVPGVRGLLVGQARPWPGDRNIQPRRIRSYDRRAVPAARKTRGRSLASSPSNRPGSSRCPNVMAQPDRRGNAARYICVYPCPSVVDILRLLD